ncbi:MAG: hypothetical protein ACXWQO_10550 [Bdellovibrionota bacterium]
MRILCTLSALFVSAFVIFASSTAHAAPHGFNQKAIDIGLCMNIQRDAPTYTDKVSTLYWWPGIDQLKAQVISCMEARGYKYSQSPRWPANDTLLSGTVAQLLVGFMAHFQ